MFLGQQTLLYVFGIGLPVLIAVLYVIYRLYMCYRARTNLFRRMFYCADNSVSAPNHLPRLIPSNIPPATLTKLTLTELEQYFLETGRSLPDTYDCIVIGSGVSGMTIASILSFEGLSVLVLDQHPDTLGGGTHVFEKEGLEFNTGLHYLGKALYDERTTTGKGDFIPMGIAAVSGREWDLRKIENDVKAHRFGPPTENETPEMESKRILRLSPEAYSESLAENFPEQAEKIAEFERISKLAEGVFDKLYLHMMLPKWMIAILRLVGYFRDLEEFAKITVNDLLDHCQIVDPKVRAVLQQVGSYGLSPAEAWMPLHAEVGMSIGYKSYPYGGFGTFAEVMVDQVTRRGGLCACNAFVKEIMVDTEQNRATGVRLKGGRKFFARKSVVSTAGFKNTLMKMVPQHVREEKMYEERIMSKVEDGKSYFVVYMGFDCETEVLGFHCNSTLYTKEACSLDRHEMDTGILQLNPENGFEGFEKVGRLSLDAQCVCDPSWKERFPGKSAIILVTIFNYDWVKPWESLTKAQRASCSEYQNVKDSFLDKICQMMYSHYPNMEEHTIFCDAGTPLTAIDYNKWDKGVMYGVKATFDRMMMHDQVHLAGIDGLILGGQDVCLMGINGAFVSGLMASGAVLKSNLVLAAMSEAKRRCAEQQKLREKKS